MPNCTLGHAHKTPNIDSMHVRTTPHVVLATAVIIRSLYMLANSRALTPRFHNLLLTKTAHTTLQSLCDIDNRPRVEF